MKKKRKLLALLIVVVILAGEFSFLNLSKVMATDNYSRYEYFGAQLNSNAQNIYKAMYKMFTEGYFKKGESMEITEYITQASISLFANGNHQLLQDYGAARDAFQYDYPDCFYVDWDNLSVRVVQDTTGTLHAYLGAGRTDSYLLKGMNDKRCDDANGGYGTGIDGAIKQYEAKLTEVVNAIKNNSKLTDGEGNNLEEIEEDAYQGSNNKDVDEVIRMIGEAHDYVVKNMIYRHEEDLVTTDRLCEKYGNEDHKDEHSTCRTAYDGLIYKTGVCEAYTRTFKAILDRLGIPCVCVYGIYSPKSTINEPHIWNYVQVDGKWYGVDVTHDDPTNDRWWYKRNSQHETREFWLVGEGTLSAHHFPQGIMSSANYGFTYPPLSQTSLRESYVNTTDEGIKVVIEKDTQFDDQTDEAFDSSTVYISYKGKNYTQNAKEGNYIIARTYMYEPGTDEWSMSDWYYIDPWYICYDDMNKWNEIESESPKIGTKGEKDAEYFTKIEYPQVRKLEVAITDVPPKYTSLKKEFEEKYVNISDKDKNAEYKNWTTRFLNLMHQGAGYFSEAEDTLTVKTDVIDNKWGNYVKPPICKEVTPGGALYIEDWHNITLKFDEDLKLKDGADKSDINIKLTTSGGAGISVDNAGATASENAIIQDIKWNGKNEVSFRFRASQMWADDYTYYSFQVENLIGVGSLKQPLPCTIGMTFRRYCTAYTAQGYKRNVYGQPQLMDSNDIDISSWNIKDNLTGESTDENGKQMTFDSYMSEYFDKQAEAYGNSDTFLNALRERLTLVTAETSPNQKTQMEDAIEQQFGEKNIVSGTVNTYNISITVCQMQVLKTGQGVRIALGFPKGTTYEDFAESGRLAFKAYHYIVDPETDKLTGKVEPIPVTVTRQGLVLLVNSFSPFTVAAVENPTPTVDSTKTLVTAASVGGHIELSNKKLEGASANVEFDQGNEKTFTIKADEGYEIDSIMLNGVRQKIKNETKDSIKISYDMFSTGDALSVNFVAKEIHEEEAEKGLSNQFTIPNIDISFEKTVYDYVIGDKIEIKANVTVSGDNFHPEGDPSADATHPDKIIYQWCKVTGGRPSPIEPIKDATTDTLTIEKATLADSTDYYLVVTPKKWDEETGDYVTFTKDKYPYNKYSNRIDVNVYNEMKIDLEDGEESKKLTGNSISGYNLALDVGSTYKLNAKVTRYDDKWKKEVEVGGRNITWESSNSDVISVNDSGILQVHKYSADPVTITAKVIDINGTERTITVKVTVNKVPVEKIEISKTKDTIKVGEEETLTATITPEDASDHNVTWTVDEASKDIIDIETESSLAAIVKAKKIGTATVTASAGGKTATCTIEVVRTPVESIVDDIPGSGDEVTVTLAEKTDGRTIKVEVLPETATNKEITWTTSDNTVATVKDNGDGTVTFVPGTYADGAANTCIITASADEGAVTRKYNIILEKEVIPVDENGVSIDPVSTEIEVGGTFDFNVKVHPEDATIKVEEWSVESEADVVSIDDAGIVTGLKPGTATIKVVVTCQNPECPTHTATAQVTVVPVEATTVKLDKTELSLVKGIPNTIEVIEVLPENTTDKTITWKISPNIAELTPSADGMSVTVTGKEKGNATITASCGEASATCKLTVEGISVESIRINEQDVKVKDDVTEENRPKLTVTYYPEDADNKEVEWSVSPEGIVTVAEDGTITPVKSGEATVTAKVKGTNIIATTDITVVPSEAEVVIYTVDQKGNFLPGMKLRLEKINDDGTKTEITEITSDGKFDFGKLKDGKYTVSVIDIPEKDFAGNKLNFSDIVEMYEFAITDGELIYLNQEDVEDVEFVDSLVLVNIVDYPDEDEEGLKAETVTPYYYKNEMKKQPDLDIEAELQAFLATKPKDPESEGGNQGGDNQGGNTGGNQGGSTGGNAGGNVGGGAAQVPAGTVGAVTGGNGSALPKTSDIAIGTFIVVMIVSIIGIVVIVYKKNKE